MEGCEGYRANGEAAERVFEARPVRCTRLASLAERAWGRAVLEAEAGPRRQPDHLADRDGERVENEAGGDRPKTQPGLWCQRSPAGKMESEEEKCGGEGW